MREKISAHKPDILILTEIRRYDKKSNRNTPWLGNLLADYMWWSAPCTTGGTMVCIRKDVAVSAQAKLIHTDPNGRHISIQLQTGGSRLLVIGTYWPAGHDHAALAERASMEQTLRQTIMSCSPCIPLMVGDMNATYYDSDRSSNHFYSQDAQYRAFLSGLGLSPLGAPNHGSPRPWTYIHSMSHGTFSGCVEYGHSRIDDIMLPTAIAHSCKEATVCDLGSISDHTPLIATLPTALLQLAIPIVPSLECPPKQRALTRPISERDQSLLTHALKDTSSGVPQKLEALLSSLTPSFNQACVFMHSLDTRGISAKDVLRLKELSGRPAEEVVEAHALALTDMIHAAHQTALRVCATQPVATGSNTHFMTRTTGKRRSKLAKKLHIVKAMKAHMAGMHVEAATTIVDFICENQGNPDLHKLGHSLQSMLTDEHKSMPLRQQLKAIEKETQEQIAIIDKAYNSECDATARRTQQKKINKQPKQAHKENFKAVGRTSQQRAGLKALQDPTTKQIETEPAKIARIIERSYTEILSAVGPKTGLYTPDHPRDYPFQYRAGAGKPSDPFTLQTTITAMEDENKGTRQWLHSSILDQAAFHECISALGKNKCPGPDGIVNELLTLLPPEMRSTIRMLFIVMWATGCTPQVWKTSNTSLINKEKGPETSLSSYRPIGLANTLYKLWTRLITNALYEYAVKNSLLSSTQAGFRKQKDTIHQLQNVIMALEDAKLYNKNLYALIVDFTSAFNTTDHDQMLWIMYDLGFPTDAIDAVKNLYTHATT